MLLFTHKSLCVIDDRENIFSFIKVIRKKGGILYYEVYRKQAYTENLNKQLFSLGTRAVYVVNRKVWI